MSVIYKTQLVPITKHDVEKFSELSEEEKALIGQVYIDKAMFNAECSRRLKDAKKKLDEYATFIKSEEHEVPCRIEIDFIDGKARIYREDTGEYVRSRPIEEDERQTAMFSREAPVKNTASEAAKKKSPGLKEQEATETQLHVAKELHDNFGPVLAGEVVGRTAIVGAAAALQWGIEEKLRRDDAARNPPVSPVSPPVSVPDEVRAAVLEANVPADMVEVAIAAIRDGAKPEVVIANATRGSKAERPAKKSKKAPVPTAEEQARKDLLDELRELLGSDIGPAATFAIVDGRMERAEAIAKGEQLAKAKLLNVVLAGHWTQILEDVFEECLSVDDAVHNARLSIEKAAEANA